jgi:hypothetical protein
MQAVAIEIRSVYGVKQAYPINEPAKLFAAIAGTKTLTTQDLRRIMALGFDVIQKAQPVTLDF